MCQAYIKLLRVMSPYKATIRSTTNIWVSANVCVCVWREHLLLVILLTSL